jgi:hypothetical protein
MHTDMIFCNPTPTLLFNKKSQIFAYKNVSLHGSSTVSIQIFDNGRFVTQFFQENTPGLYIAKMHTAVQKYRGRTTKAKYISVV